MSGLLACKGRFTAARNMRRSSLFDSIVYLALISSARRPGAALPLDLDK